MVFIIIGLSFVCVVAFFVCMIFLPEWVGISGKSAKKIQSEHQQASIQTSEETTDAQNLQLKKNQSES